MAEQTVPVPSEEKAPVAQEVTRAEDRYIAPPVDIYERDEGLTVVADLPGVTPESLDLRVDQGVLTIQARTTYQPKGTPVYREFQLVNFYRQFQLPDRIDVAAIQADLRHGVLTLQLPWAAEVKPRRIEVRAG